MFVLLVFVACCVIELVLSNFENLFKYLNCIDTRNLIIKAIWSKALIKNFQNLLRLLLLAPVQRQRIQRYATSDRSRELAHLLLHLLFNNVIIYFLIAFFIRLFHWIIVRSVADFILENFDVGKSSFIYYVADYAAVYAVCNAVCAHVWEVLCTWPNFELLQLFLLLNLVVLLLQNLFFNILGDLIRLHLLNMLNDFFIIDIDIFLALTHHHFKNAITKCLKIKNFCNVQVFFFLGLQEVKF